MLRATVNYADQDGVLELDQAEDLAVLDDDDKRLKVSHHPDGLLQFSGQGVRSGLDDEGRIRGIGTYSWSLRQPTFGPSFMMAFSDAVACGRPTKNAQRTVVFDEVDIEHLRKGMRGIIVVGYYLPVRWREFAYRTADGKMWLDLLHPNAQAVKRLRVILASKDSDLPGLIGIEVLPHGLGLDEPLNGQPSFFITTSTGNLRRNKAGDLLGDQLFCGYPMPDLDDARLPSLNFPLPAPPYTAPPGTSDILPTEEKGGHIPRILSRLLARLRF